MNADKMMAYEDGGMTTDELVEFFSELIKSGLAWKLQGRYGRTAETLIVSGFIDRHGNVLERQVTDDE